MIDVARRSAAAQLALRLIAVSICCLAIGQEPVPAPVPHADSPALNRKIEALILIYGDIESKPVGSPERVVFLKEFAEKSRSVLRELPATHPSLGGIWTLKGRCAIELDEKRDAWEAGEAMMASGLESSKDPAVVKTLAWLERKGLLDKSGPDATRFRAEREQLREAQRWSNQVDALQAEGVLRRLLRQSPDYAEARALLATIQPWVISLREAKEAEEERVREAREVEKERLRQVKEAEEQRRKDLAYAKEWEGTWVGTTVERDDIQDCKREIRLTVAFNSTDPTQPTVSWTDAYNGTAKSAQLTSKSSMSMDVPGKLRVSGFRQDRNVPANSFAAFGPIQVAELGSAKATINGDRLTVEVQGFKAVLRLRGARVDCDELSFLPDLIGGEAKLAPGAQRVLKNSGSLEFLRRKVD